MVGLADYFRVRPFAMLAALIHVLALGTCTGSRFRNATSADVVEHAQDLDDFGLDENAWLGFEQTKEEKEEADVHARNLTGIISASNTSGVSQDDFGSYPPLLILGMFNTGTNLLHKLMKLNFPDGGFGLDGRYTNGGVSGGGLKIWKHSKPEHLQNRMRSQGRPNIFKTKGVVTLAVTRDPLSWVWSMKKAPYDLESCMRSYTWQTQSCTFPAPYRPPSSVEFPWVSGHATGFHVPNIESVWNDWTMQYDHLGQYGFDPSKTVVLSYEQIVLDTEGSLAKIAAAMGKPAPRWIRHMHAPAKSHGNPSGRAVALQKLKSKSYLQQFTFQQRREVCDRLDKPLMHHHGYNDCNGWL